MGIEILTKEDLEEFRKRLLNDIDELLKLRPNMTDTSEQWLKSAEVREKLKISFSSLQNLRISGRINPKKILGVYYYSKKEIDALFK
jgi:hypothetical protein